MAPHANAAELMAALTAVPFGVTAHDADGETVACNPAAASIFGVEADELLGRDPWGREYAVHYTDGTPVGDAAHPVRRVATGGEPLTGLQLKLRLGDVSRWLEVDFAPVAQPGRAAVVALIRQPRPAPAPKAWLGDFARRFGPVLERESVAVWLKDLDGRYVFVSRGLGRLLDLRRRDMLGKCDAEILPAALAAQCAHSDRLALAACDAIEVDETLQASPGTGGRVRTLRTIKIPILDDDGTPQALGGACMDITDLRDRETALARFAHEDQLTGLSNRRLFDEHLELALARARRDGHHVAVLFIDVDGLKAVNDRLGHSAGDHLLREVATRLAAATRASDAIARVGAEPTVVARHGGDEFAVLLADLPADSDTAVATARRRIENQVQGALELGAEQIHVSVSIGAATFPKHAATAGELLKAASGAMLQGRRQRRERGQQ